MIEYRIKYLCVKQYSLIELMCKQGKGRNQFETPHSYLVLCVFDNNYKKWNVCEDNGKLRHTGYPKVEYLVSF